MKIKNSKKHKKREYDSVPNTMVLYIFSYIHLKFSIICFLPTRNSFGDLYSVDVLYTISAKLCRYLSS